ncbi:MAG TPA: hypothetical protein VK743_04350 [Steroidobacteraceae bacterium]|nr:hypothetical protein [Steroidobacteraceae bacterium]
MIKTPDQGSVVSALGGVLGVVGAGAGAGAGAGGAGLVFEPAPSGAGLAAPPPLAGFAAAPGGVGRVRLCFWASGITRGPF